MDQKKFRISRFLPYLLVGLWLLRGLALGHQEHNPAEERAVQSPVDSHQVQNQTVWQNIGLDEKLGKKVPALAGFRDEQGNPFSFDAGIDRPTLVLPIYYSCQQVCATMLGNLAVALNQVPLALGKDYRVLAFSIDAEESPAIARETKNRYRNILIKPFAEEDWRFLTGDSLAIRQFAGSIGFRFTRTGKHEFAHPNVLLVLSQEGKIIRYLYGQNFLPFDLGMAITEAAKGTPSLSIKKIISYCFAYDPQKKSYTFRIMQYLAGGLFLGLGLALYFLLRRKKS
jgi:protein SCO1/2